MGTSYTFDEGMSCHSTSIELFYFDDNFCQILLWVLALIFIINATARKCELSCYSYLSTIMMCAGKFSVAAHPICLIGKLKDIIKF